MLYIIIPLAITVAGLMFAGRIIYKKIPKDTEFFDNEVSKEDFGPTFYQKALAQFSVKSKEAAIKTSTKLIYKLKITSLKTDNFFSKLLQEMKSHKENMKPAVFDFKVEKEDQIPEKKVDFKISAIVGDSPKEMTADFSESEKFPESPKTQFEVQEQQLINQLAYNPKDVSAYKKLGWLYMENNKPVQARQSFKMAVKLGSKDKVLITKLLEIGGVVHKEGTGHHVQNVQTESVLNKVHPAKQKEVKEHKPKTRKLKVKKG
jgi:hypothetical protein